MSVLNSYLEKIAAGTEGGAPIEPSMLDKAKAKLSEGYGYVKGKAGQGYDYVKGKGSHAVQYAKDNPYKTGGGALALAGGLYGLKKLKDHMSEKQASLNFDDAYELGFYDAIEKIAKSEGEASAEAATPSRYRKAVDYVKDKAGKGYGYVKDKGGLAVQYAKDNPYKTGGGALALAGAAYGAKKLKDRMSEKKASLDLDDAYELGFYDAIEKVAEEESKGSRYSRIGGGLALPIGGIYGGGRLAEHLAETHGGKITNETLKKVLPHAKNIGRGVGGVAGLGAAYGLHKALEKKSAYEEATLDKVAMWMDARR